MQSHGRLLRGALALAACLALAPAFALAQRNPRKILLESVIPTSAEQPTLFQDVAHHVSALTLQ